MARGAGNVDPDPGSAGPVSGASGRAVDDRKDRQRSGSRHPRPSAPRPRGVLRVLGGQGRPGRRRARRPGTDRDPGDGRRRRAARIAPGLRHVHGVPAGLRSRWRASCEAGVNVVTTMYMLAGEGYGADVHQRLESAAQQGGSSLYATGIYPGHAPMVALAASAMCNRHRPALHPGVARHERLRERADVPGDEHRSADRRPPSTGDDRGQLRFVQGTDPGAGSSARSDARRDPLRGRVRRR